MTQPIHIRKALESAHVNAPEIITQLVRAHDRPGQQRLAHLYEAQRRVLDLGADVQAAITIEQQRCGAAAVPLIAARLRAVVQNRE